MLLVAASEVVASRGLLSIEAATGCVLKCIDIHAQKIFGAPDAVSTRTIRIRTGQ
jgi:hypothetical protein